MWDVKTVKVSSDKDIEKLEDALRDDWEPFSASASVAGHVFYLRKQVR